MIRFFKSRKLGITDLTWDEKNTAEYIYCPNEKQIAKLQDFIKDNSTKTQKSSKKKNKA